MKRMLIPATATLFASSALAAEPASLTVTVSGIEDGGMIPEKYAYCVPDAKNKTKGGSNINPGISWSAGPAGTKSYALIVVDSEVPTVFTDANQEGKTIATDLPRRDFYHWVLVDIPVTTTKITEGQDSKDLQPAGKVGKTPYGTNGRNDYSKNQQVIGGYAGPCPPWNDERMHRYHFQVYALDVATLGLPEDSDGTRAMQAIAPHILAKGEVTGLYTQNPKLLNRPQ